VLTRFLPDLIVAGVTFATAQVVLDLTGMSVKKFPRSGQFTNCINLGTRFARHSWDIKIEWLNESYLKVGYPSAEKFRRRNIF
jgi:hypothetical protein